MTSGQSTKKAQASLNWTVIAAAAMLAVAAVAFALVVSAGRPNGPAGQPAGAVARGLKPVDGIPCDTSEQLSYHEHAHILLLDRGRQITVPANIGLYDSCLYWLHTHDTSGIIHIEAPHRILPKLGQFFDIWGEPLSRTRIAGARVHGSEHMRVFVNRHFYHGNPRAILLYPYRVITIEIGPPFKAPKGYNFSGL